MSDNGKKIKLIIMFIIIVIVILFLFFVIGYVSKKEKKSKNSNEELVYIKNYKVNEYIPVYISDSQMCSKYLNDFYFNIRTNADKAYELLNKQYAEKKFPTKDSFVAYFKELSEKNILLEKYSVLSRGEYTYYFVYDNYGNEYIFKTNGVMQYEIFLDKETVDIYSGEDL